jgi:tetratricopeptide (TPR) repeat protein
MINHQLANQLSANGLGQEDDVDLAHDSSAFYLKLSEATLKSEPEHIALAQAVTSGLTQYAYAFIALPADELQSTDSEKSNRLKDRAKRMYERAQMHGLEALRLNQPELSHALNLSGEPSRLSTPTISNPSIQLHPDLVGLAYWTAAAWGARIALSTDEPEVVADFPLVLKLAQLAYKAQADFGNGSLASLLGVLEMSRPGGNKPQALRYFDQAIELAHSQEAGPWVSKAESYALPMGDKTEFERLLRLALELAKSHPELSVQIMATRAKWLLDQADDLF